MANPKINIRHIPRKKITFAFKITRNGIVHVAFAKFNPKDEKTKYSRQLGELISTNRLLCPKKEIDGRFKLKPIGDPIFLNLVEGDKIVFSKKNKTSWDSYLLSEFQKHFVTNRLYSGPKK